jgi:CrcB protein
MSYVWVAIGGALGSVARYGCSTLAMRLLGPAFPWGTLLVNVMGSFVIGMAAAFAAGERPLLAGDARLFVITGVLGGFTTFSAFSLETVQLARGGAWEAASLNVIASLVACLGAVALGHLAGTALVR